MAEHEAAARGRCALLAGSGWSGWSPANSTKCFVLRLARGLRLFRVEPGDPNNGDLRYDFAYDYMNRRIRKVVSVYNNEPNQVTPLPIEDDRFVWGGGSAGVSPASGGWLLLAEMVCTDPNDPCDCSSGFQPVKTYTWGLDLAGQSGAAVAPVSDRWLEGAGGTLDTVGSRQGQAGNVGQLYQWSTQPQGIEARYQYDPYGNNLLDPNNVSQSGPYAATNAFRFSTKQFDPETGLIYFGARYYDPRTGRWTTRDPVEEEGGLNLYVSVLNRPVDLFDPDGRLIPQILCAGCIGYFAAEIYDSVSTCVDQDSMPFTECMKTYWEALADNKVLAVTQACTCCCCTKAVGKAFLKEEVKKSLVKKISEKSRSYVARLKGKIKSLWDKHREINDELTRLAGEPKEVVDRLLARRERLERQISDLGVELSLFESELAATFAIATAIDTLTCPF